MPSKLLYEKKVKESNYQSKGREFAIKRGWLCAKLEAPGINGWPDYFFARHARIVLVEWKTDGGILSPQQERRINELRQHGVEVYVFEGAQGLADFKKVMR